MFLKKDAEVEVTTKTVKDSFGMIFRRSLQGVLK
jgi:hypothetical protein